MLEESISTWTSKLAHHTRMAIESKDLITEVLTKMSAAQEHLYVLVSQPDKRQIMILVGTLNDIHMTEAKEKPEKVW